MSVGSARKEDAHVGDEMPDGTVYAGISPDTGKAMYATPADAPLTYTFNRAQKYALMLDANGYKDWRVPTRVELNVLFENRAAIGGFDGYRTPADGWYWSSSQSGPKAYGQRFTDGFRHYDNKGFVSSLRCVRG